MMLRPTMTPPSQADSIRPIANQAYPAHWLAWLALVAAFCYLAARYGPGHARDDVLFNSDALFIPLFWGDTVARGTVAGWDLPTSPFFFPDMALFIPLLVLVPNVRVATLLFGLLQLALICGGFIWLQRQLFAGRRIAQTFMLLVLTLCLLFIANGAQVIFPYALTSVHHMSVLAVMPFATVGLLRALQPPGAPRRGRARMLLYLLTFLTSLSETLYIIQFVLPALAALLLWGKRPALRRRDPGLLAGGLVLTAAAGQWLRQFVVSPAKLLLYTDLTPDARATAWANMITWAGDLFRTDPIFVGVWLVGFIALAGIVGAGIRHRPAHNDIALVATLTLASMVVSLAAAVVSGNFVDTYSTRYILPAVYLPVLVGLPLGLALGIIGRADRHDARAARLIQAATGLAAVVALVYMLIVAPPRSLAFGAFAAYQEPFLACLRQEAAKRQLRYGMAPFWQAASTTVLSGFELEVVAVENHLSPVVWNTNRLRYAAPFEFVVIDPDAPRAWLIEREYVTARFGPPDDEFVCAGDTVLVYYQPGHAPLQHWFSHHPDLVQLQQPGDMAEMYGYNLPTRIGGVVVGLSQGASEQWEQDEGTLVFVPLRLVAAGSYAVQLDVFTDQDAAGAWEVFAANEDERTLLYSAPINQAGADGVTGHFDLESASDVLIVVKYSGRGALYVDRIRIAQVPPAQAATYRIEEQPPDQVESPGALHLVYPHPGSTVAGQTIDFVWQWTGAPLPPDETFEVRLWHADETIHFGAHDAAASRSMIRRIGDTYLLQLDLRGAHSVMQHGVGDYFWTVARVAVTPAYQDLQQEAAPFALHVQP